VCACAWQEESYEGFVNGSDASRAFLTADFANNATDDLTGLTPGQCLGVEHWMGFYRSHDTYRPVGTSREAASHS
jgi:hypothetical protein